MAEFFQMIGNFLSTMGSFLLGFFQNLANLIILIPRAYGFLSVLWGLMPPVLIVFCVTGVLISIVLMLLGR